MSVGQRPQLAAGQLGKQLHATSRFPNGAHGGAQIVRAFCFLKNRKGLVPEINHLGQQGIGIGLLTGCLSFQERGWQVVVMMAN